MIPATCIQKNEIKDWFEDHPSITGHVLRAYKSCVPTLLEPIMYDLRFTQNDHMVNVGFNDEPIFVVGLNKSTHMTLAVLYVFEKYRNRGIASYLIEALKVQYGGLIQVAVESSKKNLKMFYERLGLVTTGQVLKDDLSVGFVDYFADRDR